MKQSLKWLYVVIFTIGLPLFAQAEETSSTAVKTDYDSITSMLAYNRRMVYMIEEYMQDRAKIPADYKAASDKEFLRKAKSEKMGVKKAEAQKPAVQTSPSHKSTETAPAKKKSFHREY